MNKNIYIKPIAICEEIEVGHLMETTNVIIKTEPVAPDNNEKYGEDLDGQGSGSSGPPEEAKRGGGFFWKSDWCFDDDL